MIDQVGLVHMNGRIYDPEIGRFLSADPHVQEPGNLQSWNRYSYVINNPLSLTDPSGFFFSGLFRAIGNFLSSAFRAIGNVVKVALSNPIIRSIVQIVGCAAATVVLGPGGPAGCAAVSALVTLGAGGSLRDALKAAAFTFATIAVFSAVGPYLNAVASTGVGGVLIKAGVHGVIGGALSVAQGGSFLQGFAGSAVGALGGALAGGEGGSGIAGQYGDGNFANQLARALISGAAGCAGAVVSGGKCGQAAVTAAFASLYNGDGLGRAAATAVFGAIGAYGFATAGAGLAVLCTGATAGACAPATPYVVAGSAWLGRYAGATFGGLVADWVTSTSDDDTKLPDDRLNGPPGKRGNAPIGDDGHPVELHHRGQRQDSILDEMTRTEHRGPGNFDRNHSNTGKDRSLIDRQLFDTQRREYWRREWDSGRFDRLPKS